MASIRVHHIFSRRLALRDPLLRALQEFPGGSQFNLDAPENPIDLPSTRELAVQKGLLVTPNNSISPHNSRPLGVLCPGRNAERLRVILCHAIYAHVPQRRDRLQRGSAARTGRHRHICFVFK